MIEDIEKYVDGRIEKVTQEMKLFCRNEQMYINYKNIIIELKKIKAYIKNRRIKG